MRGEEAKRTGEREVNEKQGVVGGGRRREAFARHSSGISSRFHFSFFPFSSVSSSFFLCNRSARERSLSPGNAWIEAKRRSPPFRPTTPTPGSSTAHRSPRGPHSRIPLRFLSVKLTSYLSLSLFSLRILGFRGSRAPPARRLLPGSRAMNRGDETNRTHTRAKRRLLGRRRRRRRRRFSWRVFTRVRARRRLSADLSRSRSERRTEIGCSSEQN